MKKNLLKVMLFAVVGMSMVSCKSSYYQVYEVATNNLTNKDNSLVFENEDCRVLYNLWSNNGELRFAVLNKTDKDIFINMGQSFYVINGQAVEYYQGRTFTKQDFYQVSNTTAFASSTASASGTANASANATATDHSVDVWGSGTYFERADASAAASILKTTKASTSTVTTKEMEIVCIPARCFKVLGYYKVLPPFIQTCDKDKDFPSNTYHVADYSKSSSPIVFKNRLAYGFDKGELANKHIDNEFWVTSVTNYSRKAATVDVKQSSKCYDIKYSEKVREFKIGAPNKFYKYYESSRTTGGYGGF